MPHLGAGGYPGTNTVVMIFFQDEKPREDLIQAITAAIAEIKRSADRIRLFRTARSHSDVTGDGQIENVYQLQIMNPTEEQHQFVITASGIDGLQLVVVQPVTVAAASSQNVPIALRVDPAKTSAGSHPVHFHIESSVDASIKVDEKSMFYVR